MSKYPKSQRVYNERYKKTHKAKQDYYRNKSATKKFLATQAQPKDFLWIQKLFMERQNKF